MKSLMMRINKFSVCTMKLDMHMHSARPFKIGQTKTEICSSNIVAAMDIWRHILWIIHEEYAIYAFRRNMHEIYVRIHFLFRNLDEKFRMSVRKIHLKRYFSIRVKQVLFIPSRALWIWVPSIFPRINFKWWATVEPLTYCLFVWGEALW